MNQTGDWLQVRVAVRSNNPSLEWADGETIMLPSSIACMARSAGLISDGTLTVGKDATPFPPELSSQLRRVHAYIRRKPIGSRLPFSYLALPTALRSVVATIVARKGFKSLKRATVYPSWPLDVTADIFADWLGNYEAVSYCDGPTPVILSHDIDTAEGLRNLVERFIDVEEAVGARTVNYIVPCAWTIDHTLLKDLGARGHEIGIHGYDHSGRTPFATDDQIRRRLDAAQELLSSYRCFGYRAPSLLRTPALLRCLSTQFEYDSSVPTSGDVFPYVGNGCATVRPFRLEGIVEIPLTMPRDASLLFARLDPREILALWWDCAERIARAGGVVVLLTHCEDRFSAVPGMFSAYREFLENLAESPKFAFSSNRDVLDRFQAEKGLN